MGILGPPSKAETVMEVERSGSKSGHQQLVEGEVVMGRKIKENLGVSPPAGASSPADLGARKPPREPETACLSLVFPGEH